MKATSARLLETTAVLATGFCKYIFVDLLHLKFWYILFTSFCWVTYVIIQSRRNKSLLRYWGFTSDSFFQCFLRLLPVALICIVGFALWGSFNGTIVFNWHIVPILILYPLWGIIQQFLIVSLIAGNLNDVKTLRMPRFVIIILTAIIFSIVHYPSTQLIIGTFILALVYVPVFLRFRNIWVLGLWHGWLACFYYFFVLHRDPWMEVVNSI
jgi:uncharacterized protein